MRAVRPAGALLDALAAGAHVEEPALEHVRLRSLSTSLFHTPSIEVAKTLAVFVRPS